MITDTRFTGGFVAVGSSSVKRYYRRIMHITDGFWPSVSFFW